MVIDLELREEISDSEAAYLVAAALNGTQPNLGGQGCLDYRLQRSVPYGEYYYTLQCEICLCSRADRMCKQVSCAPPDHCNGYLKKDPNHCCDICVPVVVEPSAPKDVIGMKLGLMSVALCLMFAVFIFGLYRIGRKRMLVNFRSFHILDRSWHGSGDRSSAHSPRTSCASVSINNIDQLSMNNLNGYTYADAPPTYQDAVRVPSPIPPQGVTTILPSTSPCPTVEPPPPYSTLPILTLGVHPPPINGVCVLPLNVPDTHRRQPSNSRSIASERVVPMPVRPSDSCDTADDSMSVSSRSSVSASSDSEDDACSCSQCCDSASDLSLSDTEDDYAGSECTSVSIELNTQENESATETESRPKSKKKKLKKLLFRSKKCRRKENARREENGAPSTSTQNNPA